VPIQRNWTPGSRAMSWMCLEDHRGREYEADGTFLRAFFFLCIARTRHGIYDTRLPCPLFGGGLRSCFFFTAANTKYNTVQYSTVQSEQQLFSIEANCITSVLRGELRFSSSPTMLSTDWRNGFAGDGCFKNQMSRPDRSTCQYPQLRIPAMASLCLKLTEREVVCKLACELVTIRHGLAAVGGERITWPLSSRARA
jgi:hypothetical protein